MFSGRSSDPDAPSRCPYCKREVGVEGNTFRFQMVEFTAGGGGGDARVRGSVISISCSRCSRVLGFVNQ